MQTGSDFLFGVELVTTRGTLAEDKAVRLRDFAAELVTSEGVDWVSITDNAGGNPMLAPMALGKPLLYGGKEVVIHLSCKDFSRNGLERESWQLASEGFHNILTLSGDYPAAGYQGHSKPVFDLDSVGLLKLLSDMNGGLSRSVNQGSRRLAPTRFFLGAVATNFKVHENEVIPQLLKLDKKVEVGARFIVNQIGFDSRKCHELKAHMDQRGHGQVSLIGNVFVMSARIARFFHQGRMPGVSVSDDLLAVCEKQAQSPDGGRRFFFELAAKQIAIYRGLGYRGAYLGNIEHAAEMQAVLEIERSFARNDWRQFAREIRYSRPGEFFVYAEDPESGLADPTRLNPDYARSLEQRRPTRNMTLSYRLSRFVHGAVFTPGTRLYQIGRRSFLAAKDQRQGPALVRRLEHWSKTALFDCHDCGDCSLPEIAFLCPESQCAKNQRNGPCGGTREGKCEVTELECIWARAYDRLKFDRREQALLSHAPVIQDQSLRGSSSWGNTFLGRDHASPDRLPEMPKPGQ